VLLVGALTFIARRSQVGIHLASQPRVMVMTATGSGTSRPQLAARPADEPTPGQASAMRVVEIIEVEGPKPSADVSDVRMSSSRHDDGAQVPMTRRRSAPSKLPRKPEAAPLSCAGTCRHSSTRMEIRRRWEKCTSRGRHSSRVGAGHPPCPRRAALTCSVRGGSMRQRTPPAESSTREH
jgi:hypothetical protein